MSKISIPKIRPASWKVFVQGEQGVHYVRHVLREAGIVTSEPAQEPGLTDPPLYAVVAAAGAEASLTEEELLAVLQRDEKLELHFEGS